MQVDTRTKFLIESCDVRGQIVHLDKCWMDAIARTDYPENVAKVLGEAFVATALLAGTIKFDGKLTLQIRGSGDVHLLVVQVTDSGEMRGLARWHEQSAATEAAGHELALCKPADLFGDDARMTITIESEQFAEPYQGIVPLVGDNLAEVIGHYFATSEQLKTEVILAVSEKSVAGFLLQALPPSERKHELDDGWNRAVTLGKTLTDPELLEADAEVLLHRLYHEEQVRLYEPANLVFRCRCSRERTDNMLIGLGHEEVQSIVAEQGEVSIACEFCDANYRYDAIDVTALFKGFVGEADETGMHH